MYADMAADSQGWPTEGVVHVDAMALAALLEVVGPVEIEGVEYTAETAPQLVLNEPYLAFDTLDERDERLAAQSNRSEEHTSELQSLMRISYAVFCLKKKTIQTSNDQKKKRQTKNHS